jgi:hypothetical protein
MILTIEEVFIIFGIGVIVGIYVQLTINTIKNKLRQSKEAC